jgi:hypothetical protein
VLNLTSISLTKCVDLAIGLLTAHVWCFLPLIYAKYTSIHFFLTSSFCNKSRSGEKGKYAIAHSKHYYAAIAKRCIGVMPPIPIFGLSLLS